MALLASALTAALFSSCMGAPDPRGRYFGKLYQAVAGALQAKLVTFEVQYDKKGDGTIQVSDVNDKPVQTFPFMALDANHLQVDSEELTRSQAASDTGGLCFTSRTTKLCYDGVTFTYERSQDGKEVLGLVGDVSSGAGVPAAETPQAYTLDQAMSIALKRNFSSRIEYEHALQARLSAKSAYEQLLPHLSVGSVLNVVSSGFIGVLQSLGDFAPFLFPSRWIEAKETAEQARVEQDTLLLMRADLMPQIEGLAYATLQDKASIVAYQNVLAQTNDAYAKVSDLEAKKLMPSGSSNHLISVMQAMQMDQQALQEQVQKDREALSQALGFINPEAVLDVSLASETSPVEVAQPVSFNDLLPGVMDRSLELRQLSDLLDVARLQKEEIAFDWMDPAYDSSNDIGFALGAQIQISQSKIHALELLRSQMQQTLEQNLEAATEDYNLALTQFPEITTHLALQKTRWATIMAQVYPNTDLNTLDMLDVIGETLNASIGVETTRASYRIARARIDRLMMRNSYADPVFEAPQPTQSPQPQM
jgi:hypothetical protein